MHTTECCRKLHIAAETTVMEESNGINGKPVSPIVFFFERIYESREVLVLRPDRWHVRPRSTSTPRRRKVLKTRHVRLLFHWGADDIFCRVETYD
jgi:hypothetical protein